MYSNVVEISVAKAALSPLKTFLLGILSGCHVSFGALLILAVGGACPAIANANPGLKQIISGAIGLPFGLMMTILGGGELFTGNTAILTTGLVEKKVDWKDLLKNWVFTFAGNFVGAMVLAKLAFSAGM
jgi:formate/nitrite transporter FocA (FNT family)